MKFFIDPGHGGTETGAIGHGMIEKNINLVVAFEIKRILQLNGQEVKLSRESDITIDLNTRCAMANQWGANFFISVHHNACDGQKVGAEVYHSINRGVGEDLATCIAQSFEHYGRNTSVLYRVGDSGQDHYAVIRKTSMPSVITEYGYMDSLDYINFDTNQELLLEGRMIAQGCLKMIGIDNPNFEVVQVERHWAQDAYDYLKSRGITIHDTRFDDKITRGEMMVLLAQLLK